MLIWMDAMTVACYLLINTGFKMPGSNSPQPLPLSHMRCSLQLDFLWLRLCVYRRLPLIELQLTFNESITSLTSSHDRIGSWLHSFNGWLIDYHLHLHLRLLLCSHAWSLLCKRLVTISTFTLWPDILGLLWQQSRSCGGPTLSVFRRSRLVTSSDVFTHLTVCIFLRTTARWLLTNFWIGDVVRIGPNEVRFQSTCTFCRLR